MPGRLIKWWVSSPFKAQFCFGTQSRFVSLSAVSGSNKLIKCLAYCSQTVVRTNLQHDAAPMITETWSDGLTSMLISNRSIRCYEQLQHYKAARRHSIFPLISINKYAVIGWWPPAVWDLVYWQYCYSANPPASVVWSLVGDVVLTINISCAGMITSPNADELIFGSSATSRYN